MSHLEDENCFGKSTVSFISLIFPTWFQIFWTTGTAHPQSGLLANRYLVIFILFPWEVRSILWFVHIWTRGNALALGDVCLLNFEIWYVYFWLLYVMAWSFLAKERLLPNYDWCTLDQCFSNGDGNFWDVFVVTTVGVWWGESITVSSG